MSLIAVLCLLALQSVILLVQRDCDITLTDNNGYLASHHAARHNKLDCLRFLVKQGSNIEATQADGKSPSHVVNAFVSVHVHQILNNAFGWFPFISFWFWHSVTFGFNIPLFFANRKMMIKNDSFFFVDIYQFLFWLNCFISFFELSIFRLHCTDPSMYSTGCLKREQIQTNKTVRFHIKHKCKH